MSCEPYDYLIDEPDDDQDLDDQDYGYWAMVEEREAAHENGFDAGEVRYW